MGNKWQGVGGRAQTKRKTHAEPQMDGAASHKTGKGASDVQENFCGEDALTTARAAIKTRWMC